MLFWGRAVAFWLVIAIWLGAFPKRTITPHIPQQPS